MFSTRNITVKYGSRRILDGVSVDMRPGEVTAILGANGAGKSTLLKTLCGEITPDDGEILFENDTLSKIDRSSLAKRRAVLSQQSELNFPFSVFEIVLLGRNPHIKGRESALDRRIALEALSLVDMSGFAERSYLTLSGGEKQRVHLARVLSQIWESETGVARYLLLDEPTSSLDVTHQHLTLEIARKFAAENTGVAVVLHDLNLAAAYADKGYLLNNGKIEADGPPRDVITRDNIRSAYDFDAEIIEHNGRMIVIPTGNSAAAIPENIKMAAS